MAKFRRNPFGRGHYSFPTYNRARVRNDEQFAQNLNLDGNNFWVGQHEMKDPPKNVVTDVKPKEKTKNPAPEVKQPPKEEKKVPVVPKNPAQTKKKSRNERRREKRLRGAASNLQNQQVVSPPKSSGGAASNLQKQQVVRPPKSSGEMAGNLQKKQVVSQPKSSGAKNPQRPNPPVVSQPSTSRATQQKPTRTPNGDMKRHQAAGKLKNAQGPYHPYNMLKTEMLYPPPEKPEVVKNDGLRGDISKMYSCSLCQYHTPDERELKKHLNAYQHKQILKHVCRFFPKPRVDFLQNYLYFKKKKMFLEQKKSNNDVIERINDRFKGVGEQHYFHRVQAAHCLACDVLVPDVYNFQMLHIKSKVHQKNCQMTYWKIMRNSPAVAKQLFQDEEVLPLLKQSDMGQDPFKDLPVESPQGQDPLKNVPAQPPLMSSTNEVLVAEEDDEPEMMEPATSSLTINTGGTTQDEEMEEEAAQAP